MWPFKSKSKSKSKPQAVRLVVPPQHAKEFCEKWDCLHSGGKTERFEFWIFAYKVVPAAEEWKFVKADFSVAREPALLVANEMNEL